MKFTAALLISCATFSMAAPVADGGPVVDVYCLIDKRDPAAGFKRCPVASGQEARAVDFYCIIDKRDLNSPIKRCGPTPPSE
ncbi:hypothetical protein PCL_06889 [Purpureocillium lilacinum]|uniref:Uncharacterized protein n=1 Tax=Purpureocillium lilacinum TaxID=33203 RepID=A0A2U3DTX9_PURLI|nr:hypothetical protein Purlil1_11306 [Purpureocillium lilacinum]PWI65684.1 hypothetical protein PCL_06889 [Purpureocillium lilacinum]